MIFYVFLKKYSALTSFVFFAHWSLTTFTVLSWFPRGALSSSQTELGEGCVLSTIGVSGIKDRVYPCLSQTKTLLCWKRVRRREASMSASRKLLSWKKESISLENLLCAAVHVALPSSYIFTCLYLSLGSKCLTVKGWSFFPCFCAHQWLPLEDAQKLIINWMPNTITSSVNCIMG